MRFTNALISSIELQRNDQARLLLENTDLHLAVDEFGCTLLHYSAKLGNAQITQHLLDKGSVVDAKNSITQTPLALAVSSNRQAVVRILLNAGADIHSYRQSIFQRVFPMLKQAVGTIKVLIDEFKKRGSTKEDIAEKLIDAGCQIDDAILFKAAWLVEYMINRGFPIGQRYGFREKTLLHMAVSSSDLETVKVLLKFGADPNALDYYRSIPLHYLYVNDDVEDVGEQRMGIFRIPSGLASWQSLMQCTRQGIFQVGPLLLRGTSEAIAEILPEVTDWSVRDELNRTTILHYLAANKSPGVAGMLKQFRGIWYPEWHDKWGCNPLYYAAKSGNVGMLELFLSRGYEVNLVHCKYGYSPLYVACEKESKEVKYDRCVELLLQNGADPQVTVLDVTTGTRSTILDVALRANGLERVKSVIAQLAVIERLGTPVIGFLRTKIDADLELKKYFEGCREVLGNVVAGTVTIFDLLASDMRKLARVLNETVVRKYGGGMGFYLYYSNALDKRVSRGLRYRRLQDVAGEVVAVIFEWKVDKTHLIVRTIMEYLDEKSLYQLGLLGRERGFLEVGDEFEDLRD